MPEPLTIWSNAQLPPAVEAELIAGVGRNRLVFSQARAGILTSTGPDPLLAEADIAFGQPDPEQVLNLPRLKWIHLTTAGYTRYDRPDLRSALIARSAILTNSSSVFAEPCAQHVVAFMLANSRALPAALMNQMGPRAWPDSALRGQSRLLAGQNVLLLSFGSIARRIVEMLAPFRMNVIAFRQRPRGDETIATYPIADLDSHLPEADHVVNILPASATTNRFMNAERFAKMNAHAVFYNIGRGTTVDQEALIGALQSGRLGAAYLDVTDPEPLPPAHPLWRAANCYITPHTAGGHADEYAANIQHFLGNLKNFQSGVALRDRII
jgi:phosphoglycerate dehydrogenase-like enzyme